MSRAPIIRKRVTLHGRLCRISKAHAHPAEYPVVFGTSTCCGDSVFSSFAIPAFTQFFALMNPTP